MTLKNPRVLWLIAPAFVAVTACGDKGGDDDDAGSLKPDSFVTEADLAPGAVVAFDAAEVKSKMESGGEGNYVDNDPDDEDESSSACFDNLFNAVTAKAEGSELLFEMDIDMSGCFLETYKSNEGFEGADYSEFKVTATSKVTSYLKCEGADLSAYNGKTLKELESIPECDKASTVKVLSESKGGSSVTGKIKNVTVEGSTDKYVFIYDNVSSNADATRTAGGDPCTATLTGAEFVYSDGCANTSRSVTTADTTTVEGSEPTVGDNVGKATYEKLEYVGLKQAADETTLWYTGGQFDVTYNDWTGTVKYSSGTSEPIFEMKKGSEVSTGTIKAPKANLTALFLSDLKAKLRR